MAIHAKLLVCVSSTGLAFAAAPAALSATTDFLYADTAQLVPTTFASGNYQVADPRVNPHDFHSLAEIAGESADGQQIVEIGWIVAKDVNGDSLPHLFIFHWIDGNPTCYNGCGFVSTSKTIKPGMTLPVSKTPLGFAMTFHNGGWWLYAGGTPFGYFPGRLWKNSFTQLGLVQWFGEVAASSMSPKTQMGDGILGTDPGSARIASMKVGNLYSGKNVPATAAINAVTNPAYYDVGAFQPSHFRFGGPGAQ